MKRITTGFVTVATFFVLIKMSFAQGEPSRIVRCIQAADSSHGVIVIQNQSVLLQWDVGAEADGEAGSTLEYGQLHSIGEGAYRGVINGEKSEHLQIHLSADQITVHKLSNSEPHRILEIRVRPLVPCPELESVE